MNPSAGQMHAQKVKQGLHFITNNLLSSAGLKMCVKANLINSVVLLTVHNCMSHTYKEKKFAFEMILNEFIFDRM